MLKFFVFATLVAANVVDATNVTATGGGIVKLGSDLVKCWKYLQNRQKYEHLSLKITFKNSKIRSN
jgi:hypothetical protein